MKKTSLKSKEAGRIKSVTPETQLVRIEFTRSSACNVFIAGTFNDWHPSATEMIALGEGRWAKELTLPPGTYEYRLVVDNEWMADPRAAESAPNPFGGVNSVMRILPDEEPITITRNNHESQTYLQEGPRHRRTGPQG